MRFFGIFLATLLASSALAGETEFRIPGANALGQLDQAMRHPGDILRKFRPARPDGLIAAQTKIKLVKVAGSVGYYNMKVPFLFSEDVIVHLSITNKTKCEAQETGYRVTTDLSGSGARTLDYLHGAYVDLCAGKSTDAANVRTIFGLAQVDRGPKFDPKEHLDLAKRQVANLVQAIIEVARE